MTAVWRQVAVDLVAAYAAEVGGTFTTEDIREWVGDRIPEAAPLRIWDMAMKQAVKDGVVSRCGHSRSRTVKGRVLCAYRQAFFTRGGTNG